MNHADLRNALTLSFHDKWHHTKPANRKDIVRAVVEHVLATPGVVVLPPAVAEVLRTGEPTEAMHEAAIDVFRAHPGVWVNRDDEWLERALRAALAVLRET